MGNKETIKKAIEVYGEDAVYTASPTEVYSEDTGWSTTGGTASTIKVIPYNYFKNTFTTNPYGNLSEGQVALIADFNFTGDAKDTFVYLTKNYIVDRIEPLRLQQETLATIIVATEKVV